MTEDEDPRDVLADLMTYSIEREEEEFAAKTHTCDLCGTDKPGTEFLRLPECSHAYCRACMAAMCSLHVR